MKTLILTKEDAQEIRHKMQILADEPDLQADYEIIQKDADRIVQSIPSNGGEWAILDFYIEAVRGELADQATILHDIARDAYRAREYKQQARIRRQAKRFESFVEQLS